MNATDLAIILTSLVVVVAVGLWASRNQGKSDWDYFLASGKLPWWIIGAAFVSTSVSSEQIVGTVGVAYEMGMGVTNWEWFILPQYKTYYHNWDDSITFQPEATPRSLVFAPMLTVTFHFADPLPREAVIPIVK